MEQRLILSGPHAGQVVDKWVADEIDCDHVELWIAAQIVREHNERTARQEQEPLSMVGIVRIVRDLEMRVTKLEGNEPAGIPTDLDDQSSADPTGEGAR